MLKSDLKLLDEYVKELDFNLEVLQRFMPVFNITDKDVISSLEIGMDMLTELRNDIHSDDTLRHTVNIDKVFDEYKDDMSKITTSASSEIRLLKEKIVDSVEAADEKD